jgi:hypothetical protein
LTYPPAIASTISNRDLRDRAVLVWLSNAPEPGNFAVDGVEWRRGGRLHSKGDQEKSRACTRYTSALIVMLAQQMPFHVVAKMTGLSWYRVKSICDRYVDEAVKLTDLSEVTAVSIDETSSERGHEYVTLVADEAERRVIFVTEGKNAETIEAFGKHLASQSGNVENIKNVVSG